MKRFFFECVPVFIERAPGVTVGAALVEAAATLPLKRGRICIYWGVQLMGTHKQARSKLEKKKSLADFNG